MNCENCKYPTLCKAVVLGSVVSVITAAWCYYRSSSKPKNEEQKTQPDVNM
jgi:hypothetical protein